MRVLLFAMFMLFLSTSVFSQISPQQQIQQMVDGVLAVLNSSDDVQTKKQHVSGMVQEYLGVESLSQRTLGIYWKSATEAERQKFQKLYVQILENTYLNRIGDYTGGRVDYLQERVKDDKAILDTAFVTDKVDVPVQYKMVLESGAWQIYDVVIEGVSLIRSYRSTYNEIIRKEGFDGLFTRMEKKLAEGPGEG